MLTFDADSHAYFWDGKPVPGVTSLIEPLYDFSCVSDEDMAKASYRGTAVHLACELYDIGALDESSLDPAWRPYLDAWISFKEERGFVVVETERKVYHRLLRYAGTLDRRGMFEEEDTLLDIKTSSTLSPAIGIQLAAYEEARKSEPDYTGPKKLGRVAVQLKDDGTYKVERYKDSTDWSVFVGLLNKHNWCKKHHIKEK